MFNLLRSFQTVFHSSCTILHPHQPCTRIRFSTFSATFVMFGCFIIKPSYFLRQFLALSEVLFSLVRGNFFSVKTSKGFPGGLVVKNHLPGSIPVSERSPRGGNGNLLWYSCWENPIDRGALWATVHGVPKSQTRLSTAQSCQNTRDLNKHKKHSG